jgi:hypothetical protein
MKSLPALMLLLASAIAPSVHASDAPAGSTAVRVFIEHEVSDYAAWRTVYDSFAATQRKMGVTFQAVYQSVNDPNDVVIIHDFATLQKAKAFIASGELKAAMDQARVKSAPHITITARAKN